MDSRASVLRVWRVVATAHGDDGPLRRGYVRAPTAGAADDLARRATTLPCIALQRLPADIPWPGEADAAVHWIGPDPPAPATADR